MTNAQLTKLLKQLDARMKGVAKERDKLDTTIDTFVSLLDDCREAYDDLQRARDALSRLV